MSEKDIEIRIDPKINEALRKKGAVVTSDLEYYTIPYCVCCDWKIIGKQEIEKKKGRELLGAIPVCDDCFNDCKPDDDSCSRNKKTGRSMTITEVVADIMESE